MIKRWFRDLKLRHKLIIFFALLLFMVMACIYAYFPEKQRKSVYSGMEHRIQFLARSLSLAYATGMADNNYTVVNVIGQWLRDDRNFQYYYIYDESGDLFMHYPETLPVRPLNSSLTDSPVIRDGLMQVKEKIIYKEKFLGNVVLAMDLNDAIAVTHQINRASLLIIMALFTAALLLTWAVAAIINRPVQLLTDSVNRIITHGDYSERTKGMNKDEIGVLARRFNEMIGMIEDRDFEVKQQFEELQKMHDLKDHFLAATTHDLRSPITAILGFSDLILMNEKLDEDDRKRLYHVRQSAEFLAGMVNDILEISRLESGKSDLKLKPLQILRVVQSSINTLQYMAMPKEIMIALTDHTSGDKIVRGDFDALLRIFNNLISNAVKFTPRGGKIEVTLETNGDFLDVSVADNGIGIDTDKIPLLFESFATISRRGTDGEKGTGLGLSISKNLALKHNGNILVQSSENKGSCFTVQLPLLKKD